MSVTEDLGPTPCPACTELRCEQCTGSGTDHGEPIPCPCADAGHPVQD